MIRANKSSRAISTYSYEKTEEGFLKDRIFSLLSNYMLENAPEPDEIIDSDCYAELEELVDFIDDLIQLRIKQALAKEEK